MKKIFRHFLLISVVFLGACSKDDNTSEIDTEYPVIDISESTHFPKQCSTVKRGETFTFRARFSDNVELGSSSIDIHHNFDHHTHSTEIQECVMDPIKAPVNPFQKIQNYTIPKGQRSYEIEQDISIPADVDLGDYHFMIRLTDQEGWQTIIGLSIKIVE